MNRWYLVGLALIAAAPVGCVTPAFAPQQATPLAHLSIDGGGNILVERCGRKFSASNGLTLSGFDEAFPPGSAAAEHARSAERHSEAALALNVASLVAAAVAGALIASADYDSTPDGQFPDQAIVGLGVAFGSLIPSFIGGGQAMATTTRTLDAVNAYNEMAYTDPAEACADVAEGEPRPNDSGG